MKKSLAVVCILAIFALAGCTMVSGTGTLPGGCLFTDVTIPEPTRGSQNELGSKVGKAEAINILGIITTGDCSIVAAAQNGGITKIKTADRHINSILGLYTKVTTIVTGE